MDLAFDGRSFPNFLRKAFNDAGALSAEHIHKGMGTFRPKQ